VQVRNFDWHASLKDFREAGTVEALWQSLQPFVPGCGMALGSISPPAGGGGRQGDNFCAASLKLLLWAPHRLRKHCAPAVVASCRLAHFCSAQQVLCHYWRQLYR